MNLPRSATRWLWLCATTIAITAISIWWGATVADLTIAYIIETLAVTAATYFKVKSATGAVTATDLKVLHYLGSNANPPPCWAAAAECEGRTLPKKVAAQVADYSASFVGGLAAFVAFLALLYILAGNMLGAVTGDVGFWLVVVALAVSQQAYELFKRRADSFGLHIVTPLAKILSLFIVIVVASAAPMFFTTPVDSNADPNFFTLAVACVVLVLCKIFVETIFLRRYSKTQVFLNHSAAH